MARNTDGTPPQLAMKYHPDKNPDSTSMYLRIDEAYKVGVFERWQSAESRC
jgi:hypothetical protein